MLRHGFTQISLAVSVEEDCQEGVGQEQEPWREGKAGRDAMQVESALLLMIPMGVRAEETKMRLFFGGVTFVRCLRATVLLLLWAPCLAIYKELFTGSLELSKDHVKVE